MLEWMILGAFSAALLLCVVLHRSIIYALCFGFCMFFLYGRHRGFRWRELGRMTLNGIKAVGGLLVINGLIGILTAFWRAAGTIPVMVCYASKLIRPSVFLLMTFLLNGGVGILTGTTFGTAATMGVICATMGTAMQISPILTGGAVLSGVYFADRWSPVSASVLVISSVTKTDIYRNSRNLLRTGLGPFALSCIIYLVIGFLMPRADGTIHLESLFSTVFRLHWTALIPAAMILLLSLCRIRIQIVMLASALSAVPLCLFLQHIPASELLQIAIYGFYPDHPEVAAMVGGGGMISMAALAAIVCLASCSSELLRNTGLLDHPQKMIRTMEQNTESFAATLMTAVAAGLIACNQTLTIFLVNQLCSDRVPDKEQFAVDLEDSAAVIAALVPWSIAGSVPLSFVGAPICSLLVSFFLILVPLWRLAMIQIEKRQKTETKPATPA